MQELADDTVLKFEVNQTHTVVRSVAPNESAYCRANVCCAPDPLLGVTDAVVTAATVPGTSQAPIGCHPLLALDPAAYIQMLCNPAYAAAKVIGRFSVRF